MPVVKIDWAEGRTDIQKEEIITRITDAIAEVCQIEKNRVTVLINDLPKTNVGVGGLVRSK
jgi:4-oxalocrotonate tautomerase